jgi:hypothetical protein
MSPVSFNLLGFSRILCYFCKFFKSNEPYSIIPAGTKILYFSFLHFNQAWCFHVFCVSEIFNLHSFSIPTFSFFFYVFLFYVSNMLSS